MQHLLSKNKYLELKDAYIKFNSNLDVNEQSAIREHTAKIWDDLSAEFAHNCQNDPKWVKLHNEIKDYENVTSFNMEDHFRRYIVPNHVDNNQTFHYDLEYDAAFHQECRTIYQNINDYTKKANQKLTRLNHKKFAFRKGARIEKIQDDLHEHQMIANKYAELEQQDHMKRHYLISNTATYQKAKMDFDKLNKQHAEQIIAKALKNNVGIICFEHNATVSPLRENGVDYQYLNTACNEIRDIIMEMIVLDHEANYQQEGLTK